MKKRLLLGVVLASGLFALPARADVDARIGMGTPQVMLVGGKHAHSHHRHVHRHPPVRHRYAPPVYYPERVYRHSKRHRHFHGAKPLPPSMTRHHLHRGTRPLPPPHAHAYGWRR
ncbi:MAG TPA: hypothetical protein VKZ52_06710 [Burkholderiaceae bacterium]|nr:hypothetical protein [Burkholderiaceae bacterium]